MTSTIANPAPDAFKLALLQQALLLPLAAMTLDGGGILLITLFALSSYWGGVFLIRFRRHGSYTRLDLFLFRWGFLVLLVLSFFVARWIWSLRGYVF